MDHTPATPCTPGASIGFVPSGAPGIGDCGHAAIRTRALSIGTGGGLDDAMRAYVAGYGIDVQAVDAGEQLRRRLAPGRFELVLVDLGQPHDEGLCLWVRQAVPDIPLIALTPRDDYTSRVLALDLGADDSLAKPFEPRELVARIHAVMRRARPRAGASNADRFDEWTFDRTQRQLVMRDGAEVPLSSYEGRLLSAFIDHRGQVLGRDRLLAMANASSRQVTYRSVDLAVSRLRAKMDDDLHAIPMIRTIRGEGYLFSGSHVPRR